MMVHIGPGLHGWKGGQTQGLIAQPLHIDYNTPMPFFAKYCFCYTFPLLQAGHLLPPACQGPSKAIARAYLPFTLASQAACPPMKGSGPNEATHWHQCKISKRGHQIKASGGLVAAAALSTSPKQWAVYTQVTQIHPYQTNLSCPLPNQSYKTFICKAPLRNYPHIYIYIKKKQEQSHQLTIAHFSLPVFRTVNGKVSHGVFPCPSRLFHPASIPQDECKI